MMTMCLECEHWGPRAPAVCGKCGAPLPPVVPKDEPEAVAVWRALIEHRDDLIKTIIQGNLRGAPTYTKDDLREPLEWVRRRTPGLTDDAYERLLARVLERLEASNPPEIRARVRQAREALKQLRAHDAKIGKATTATKAKKLASRLPNYREACVAVYAYLKKRSPEARAWAILRLAEVRDRGELSFAEPGGHEIDLDELEKDARAWGVNGRGHVKLANYIVGKIAGLKPESRLLPRR